MFKLPRLLSNAAIVDATGKPTPTMIQWWQTVVQRIEQALGVIIDLTGIQEQFQQAIDNLNSATADTVAATALANSYVSGLTITAMDTGTDVTIAISAHQRTYATKPPTTVAVAAGTITAVPYATSNNPQAYVYYDQASRAGGSVSYQRTFDNSQVAQINNRHSVGVATLPAAGEPPAKGKPITPPGGSYDIVVANA